MDFRIRPFQDEDLDQVVELSVQAWKPVFTTWERILGPTLYPIAIFEDWRTSQAEAVAKWVCDEAHTTHVAVVDRQVAGFITHTLDREKKQGEVYLLAVSPTFQNQGIGTKLNLYVIELMKEAGMILAVVGTGGDDGHAPARRTYEKAGYTGLPLMRYYQDLRE